ncbi:MAG: hypothetical protein ACI4AD_00360 [Roseburia sp.]
MRIELTQSMAKIVQDVVKLTPKTITNMSIDEIEKHVRNERKKNKMFHKIWRLRFPKRKSISFSKIQPRGSMIAAHHRFSYPEETNRKIMKMK